MRTKRKRRVLSVMLCLCMLFSIFPMSGMTYAAETPCPNHPIHTLECGYVEAVEGQSCADSEIDGNQVNDSEATLEGDGESGHIETVEGQPCTHTCELCDGSVSETSGPESTSAGHEGDCDTVKALGASLLTNDKLIVTDDYTFDPDSGKLTIITNDGTNNWRSDTNIAVNDDARYNAVLSVVIKRGVTEIGDSAFNSCENLTTVDLPASLTTIERDAFFYCLRLSAVDLPYGLTTIGNMAFYYCQSLTRVDLPASVETIAGSGFYKCANLAELTFHSDDPPRIDYSAFDGVAGNGTIKYPYGKGTAYTEDWKNDDLELPSWMLQEQGAPAGLVTGEGYTFEPSTGKLTITSNEGTTGWRTDSRISQNNTARFNAILSVEFQNDVIEIGDSAFADCTGLTTVDLPAGLQIVGNDVFSYCTGLTAINVAAENTAFTSENGVLYNKAQTMLLQYPIGKTDTSFAVPQSVTDIGKSAFSHCKRLTKVDFSAGLQTIGEFAFSYCTGLTSVDFPASLHTIGAYTFSYCRDLDRLTFRSDALPTVSGNAFLKIADDGTIYFPNGKGAEYSEGWKNNILKLTGFKLKEQANPVLTVRFGDNDEMEDAIEDALENPDVDQEQITTIQLIGSAGEITNENWTYLMKCYSRSGKWISLTTLDLSSLNGLKKVANETNRFSSGLSKLQWVILPNSLTTIGNKAFYSCSGLTSVTLPANLTTIGYLAFAGCTGLRAINVDPGNTVFAEEDGVLYNKAKTTLIQYPLGKTGSTFIVPQGVTQIGNSAFANCGHLTQVDLPASLEIIDSIAFSNCSGLTQMDLPAGLKAIGTSAFSDCTNLNMLIFRGEKAPNLGETPFGDMGIHDNVPANGTLYHPAGAVTEYAISTFGSPELDSWTRCALYTVIAGADSGGVISPSGNVPAMSGETLCFTITTDNDYEIADVTVDDVSVGAVSSYTIDNIMKDYTIQATFRYTGHVHSYGDWKFDKDNHWKECTAGDDIIAKAAHTPGGWVVDQPATETETGSQHQECTVCNYVMKTEAIDPIGVKYTRRTLTDPDTGIQVSGLFSSDAAMAVKKKDVLHEKGTCPACDDIRAQQEKGELIALYDISLSAGSYQGELQVCIPVGEAFNGQTVYFLHCNEKVLESQTLTALNGLVKGTFGSLSLFAVAKEESKITVSGLPETYTLTVGQNVSWTPEPAGGTWRYDKKYLEMTQNGGTCTFRALKAGKTTATYTVGGVSDTVTITINGNGEAPSPLPEKTAPQTGDTSSTLPIVLLALTSLLGCIVLISYKKPGRKIRQELALPYAAFGPWWK
ncbi:hypothetical protein GCM10008922_23600 [Faecalicatena contorta]|uniref:leucine-rich repeat domain-containing protein n=1 Tax=Faecalicatena contorta TaxID=39482 RepID=UPI0031D3B44D